MDARIKQLKGPDAEMVERKRRADLLNGKKMTGEDVSFDSEEGGDGDKLTPSS